jgi:hypothetical protein
MPKPTRIRPIATVETNEVVPSPPDTARMPTIISPPFTKSNIGIMLDRSFLAITNAIIDMITALPPKAVPLVCSSNGRNPRDSSSVVWPESDEKIIATSIPYNTNNINETPSSAIATFVFVILIYRLSFVENSHILMI